VIDHRWLARLPKAELHLHLEGAISPRLAAQLASEHGVTLPPPIARAVRDAATGYRFEDFRTFIEIYLGLTDLLRTADDYRRAVEQLGDDLRAQGVVWAEVTFTPVTHQNRGVAPETFMAGLEAGRRAVAQRGGPQLRWVFDIVRHLPEQAEPTLALAVRHAESQTGMGVVGLGLAGPEARSAPYARFAPVFARAREAGLVSVPHAGEHAGAQSVREAVEVLGATRIGHGVRCLEDPDTVTLLRSRGVSLEVCPHSNIGLGVTPDLASHPLPALLDAGLSVTLATDDPPLFGTTLIDTYVDCADAFGWSGSDVVELCAESLRRATMTTADASSWLNELSSRSAPIGEASP